MSGDAPKVEWPHTLNLSGLHRDEIVNHMQDDDRGDDAGNYILTATKVHLEARDRKVRVMVLKALKAELKGLLHGAAAVPTNLLFALIDAMLSDE